MTTLLPFSICRNETVLILVYCPTLSHVHNIMIVRCEVLLLFNIAEGELQLLNSNFVNKFPQFGPVKVFIMLPW